MAALDFPASPVDGQIFNAPNGVTYTWIAAVGFWKASGTAPPIVIVSPTPPASPGPGQQWFNSTLATLFIWYDDGNSQQWVPASPNMSAAFPGGDFFTAVSSTGFGGALTTILFPVAMSGNAGNWYNPANGRYTHIFSTFSAGLSTGPTQVAIVLRKNGVAVISASQVPANINWAGDPSVVANVDANGTDWFDIQASCNNGSNVASWMWFGAFPLNGIKGPPGDIGAPVANFNVRATVQDTLNGPSAIALFRPAATPVKDFDPDNVWDLANSRFVAPSTGRYAFQAQTYLSPNAAGQAALYLRHMTSAGASIRDYADAHNVDASAYGASFHLSMELQMTASERVQFVMGAPQTVANILAIGGSVGGITGSTLTFASGRKVV
jgi:hypothetical protein